MKFRIFCCVLLTLVACSRHEKPDTPIVLPPAKPVVEIVGETQVKTNQNIILDVSNSRQANRDQLFFLWFIKSQPEGSDLVIKDPRVDVLELDPEVIGEYEFLLYPSFELVAGDPLTYKVEVVGNIGPTAEASFSKAVIVNEYGNLDASASHDEDDPQSVLGYHWQVIDAPTGSQAQPLFAYLSQSKFKPDKEGLYNIKLTVNDREKTHEQRFTVSAYANTLPQSNVPQVMLVGAQGRIHYSFDRETWLDVEPITEHTLNAVINAGNRFVAVGDNGVVLRSVNGVDWSVVSSVTTENLNAIAFNGTRYVAVGDAGVIIHSIDANIWGVSASPIDGDLKSVHSIYYNSSFVAGGTVKGLVGGLIRSNDGRNWFQEYPKVDTVDVESMYETSISTIIPGRDTLLLLGETRRSADPTVSLNLPFAVLRYFSENPYYRIIETKDLNADLSQNIAFIQSGVWRQDHYQLYAQSVLNENVSQPISITIDADGGVNATTMSDPLQFKKFHHENEYAIALNTENQVVQSINGLDWEPWYQPPEAVFNDLLIFTHSTDAIIGDDFRYYLGYYDADGHPLTYRIENMPSWMLFDNRSGWFHGTPRDIHFGRYEDIVVTVSDPHGSTQPITISVDVHQLNSQRPSISGSPPTSINHNQEYRFAPTMLNVTNISIENRPPWLRYNSDTKDFVGTPGIDNVGLWGNIIIKADNGVETVSLPPFMINVKNSAPMVLTETLVMNTSVSPYMVYTNQYQQWSDVNLDAAAQPVNRIVYIDTIGFVAMGDNGFVAISLNGIDFNVQTTDTLLNIIDFAWTGNEYIAVAESADGLQAYFLASADGMAWTETMLTDAQQVTRVVFSQTESNISVDILASALVDSVKSFFHIKPLNPITTIADIEWQFNAYTDVPFIDILNGIDEPLAIIEGGGIVKKELDNNEWNGVVPFADVEWHSIIWNGMEFIAAGEQTIDPELPLAAFLARSSDALDWQAVTLDSVTQCLIGTGENNIPCIEYEQTVLPDLSRIYAANSRTFLLGGDQLAISIDMQNWFYQTRPQNFLTEIAAGSTTLQFSLNVDEVFLYEFYAQDKENDSLTFEINNNPTWLQVDSATGVLSGTPDAIGQHTNIIVTVSDGQFTRQIPAFNIEVQ